MSVADTAPAVALTGDARGIEKVYDGCEKTGAKSFSSMIHTVTFTGADVSVMGAPTPFTPLAVTITWKTTGFAGSVQ